MNEFIFRARHTDDTDRFAKALAASLPRSFVIGLTGTLGAGKTYLVRQVARWLGIEPLIVVSPTFTLCNEYHGERVVYHFDLYRVTDADSLFELGMPEYFESAGICFLEWADRFESCLPRERLMIDLDVVNESERIITVRDYGDEGAKIVERLMSHLAAITRDD